MDKSLAQRRALDICYAFLMMHFPGAAKKLRKEAGLGKDIYAEPETLEKLAAWYMDLPRARQSMGMEGLAATEPRAMEGDPAGSVWSFEWDSAQEDDFEKDASASKASAVPQAPALDTTAIKQKSQAKKRKKGAESENMTEPMASGRSLDNIAGITNGASAESLASVAQDVLDKPTKRKRGEKPLAPSNEPFRRVKAEDVTFKNERLRDNSFTGSGAGLGDYGAKAHRDLMVTRGDGFRKGKAKFKKGKHYGGEITLESRSIKFE